MSSGLSSTDSFLVMEEEKKNQKFIEEMDSLWWFSSIFSSTVPQLEVTTTIDSEAVSVTEEDTDEKKMTETTSFMEDEEKNTLISLGSDEEKKPIPEIHFETEQVDSEVDETSSEFGSLSESDFEDFEDSESEIYGMGFASVILKEEERNRRIKEFNGSQKFGDLGFDFGDIGLDLMLVPMIPRIPRSGNSYLVSKMPPLSDGMAMKKHLKLWAHAVACNVR